MKNGKRYRHIWINRTVGILICVALFGVIAWAQKGEHKNEQARTWADLGVTPEHQTQLKALWELKRQKEIQAVKDLKTLNRFAKDSLATDAEIQETLEKFRVKRKETQGKIDKAEEALIEILPTQAQLHLTLLGILDNGVPRKITKPQTNKKTAETPQQKK